MKSWAVSRYWLAASLIVAFVIVVVLMVWVETTKAPAPPDKPPTTGAEVTISGEVICLPHKDTSGPQTLECAFGVKLDDGTYYALRDVSEDHRNVSTLPSGKKVRLTGTLKEEVSDRYQSTGTFTVTDAEGIE